LKTGKENIRYDAPYAIIIPSNPII